MRTILLLTLFVSLSGVLPGFAQDTQQLDDINYSFGHFLGKDLQRNAVQLRIDRLLDGLFDASEQLEPQYSQDEMQALRGVKHAKEEEILEKINYAYGYKTGQQIVAAKVEINAEPLLFGVTDVTDHKKIRFSVKEMTELLAQLKKDQP